MLIVARPLGTASQDAVSTWPTGGKPMMLVNSGLPTDRLRFTVAHELGHLVMHHAPADNQEEEANTFASEFLAPAEEIQPDLVGLAAGDMGRLMQLKTKWGMSIAALIRRAYDLDQIDEARYRDFHIRLSRLGWRQMEPGNLPPESPRLMHSVISALRTQEHLDIEALAFAALMTPKEFGRVFLPDERPDAKVVVHSA
ncbi:Zn-dependent peptidase ImmA (M78 family) [Curtobacterium sp. PhB191]|nr:Zn-dependent peptidase ImmA (M78 family) [Curtobacterium sp. PhB191]